MESTKGKYIYAYPRPSVTTACVIFGYDVREGQSVLLVQKGDVKGGANAARSVPVH